MKLQLIRLAGYLDRVALFSLIVIAFQLPISNAVIESFSILALFSFCIVKLILKQGIEKSVIYNMIFLYFMVCFFSIFSSTNFIISSRNFIGKVFQYTLFVFVISETLNNQRRLKYFVMVMLASSFVLGVDGIYQYFTHKDFIRNRAFDLLRIHATFPTANDFGCYLVAMIPFSVACFSFTEFKKRVRLLHLLLFALLFACLVLTLSKGAWFSFIGSMLFIAFWIRAVGGLFLILIVGLIFSKQHFYPLLSNRLNNLFVFSDNGVIDRKMIWHAGWKMFMSKPLLGVGLGAFMFNFVAFAGKEYPYAVPYAHNCYLQIASETGILGLAAFLLILFSFFYFGIKILNSRGRTFSWFMLLASLAAVLGYSIQMAVDTNFYNLDLSTLFWLLLGVGLAAMKNLKSEPKKKLTKLAN